MYFAFARMKKLEWKCCLYLTLACLWMQIHAEKEKRQIFREQVLPELGGKIPEEAFTAERLKLNRLDKEGFTIPDGVLEARYPHIIHPYHRQSSKNEILKVYLTRDGRYVPPERHYHHNDLKAVDTTYVIRKPIGHESEQKIGNSYVGDNFYVLEKPQVYTKLQKYTTLLPTNPVIEPLVVRSSNAFWKKKYYPSWNYIYDWDAYHEALNDYYKNIALINSHRVSNY